MGYNYFIGYIGPYGSIIRLAVVAFQNREITRNSVKICPCGISRLSKVIDIGVNRKPIATSY